MELYCTSLQRSIFSSELPYVSLQNQICPTSDYAVRCLETAETCSLTQLHEKSVNVLADPDVPLKVNNEYTCEV